MVSSKSHRARREEVKGIIIRLIPNKGYGFIRGDDKLARFFHAKDLPNSHFFDTLREGMTVDFNPIETERGLRASYITVSGP